MRVHRCLSEVGLLEDGTLDDLEVPFLELFSDDEASGGESIEGDLREEMVLCLILHAAHNNEREDIVEGEVATRLDLMLEEFHIDFTLELVLVLVIADQYRSGE